MIPGLNWAQYGHLVALGAGLPSKATEAVATHCYLKRWVRAGRLTDDGREVLARAQANPPAQSRR